MDTGAVGQTGLIATPNVMMVREHDSGSATILSQNMVVNTVSETPRKVTYVRRGDVHLVRNDRGFCKVNYFNEIGFIFLPICQ